MEPQADCFWSGRFGYRVYVPSHFRLEQEDALYAVIDRFMFAMVVSSVDLGPPRATLAPFVVRQEDGRQRLWGHVARANPQWRDFCDDREILVVFRGPHAYISPSWYADEPNVPTWNYVAVQVCGRPRVLEQDDPRVRWILERTVEQAESRLARPWHVGEASEYVRELAPRVCAFEVEVTGIQGSVKLNQNHPHENRLGVIAALETSDESDAREIARLMREREEAP